MTKTVAAPEFEANCLALLDEVAENHDEIVVLKDGKPHAKVVPVTATRQRRFVRSTSCATQAV